MRLRRRSVWLAALVTLAGAAVLLFTGRRIAAAVVGNAGWVLLLHERAGGAAEAVRAHAAFARSSSLHSSIEMVRGEALAASDAGDAKAAQAQLTQALSRTPADALLLAADASVAHSLGDLNGAATALAAAYRRTAESWPRGPAGAARLDAQFAARLRSAGWNQLQAGQLGSAQVSLDAALQLQPADGETVFDQALLADARGDWAAAADCYQQAIELGYVNADVHFRLGDDYFQRLSDAGAAQQQFELARALDPRFSVQLYLDLASIDENMQRLPEAVHWLTLAETLFPDAPAPGRELARLRQDR